MRSGVPVRLRKLEQAISAVADRVSAVFERVTDSVDGSLAVLVSHGAAIGLGIARLLEHNVGRLPDLDPEPVPVLAAGPEEETALAGSAGAAPGSGD